MSGREDGSNGRNEHGQKAARRLKIKLSVRDAVKVQQIADTLGDLLVDRGSDEATARFAAHIAIACYQTVKRLGNNPRTLVDATQAAFERVLTLGTGATEPQVEPPDPSQGVHINSCCGLE
jgi:hypothetical protein